MIQTVNQVLAVAGLFAAIGAVAAMNGRTDPILRVAIGLTGLGLAAQLLGELSGQWGRYADTLTFGGAAALLLASRRVPRCFLERWSRRAAAVVAAVATAATLFAWSTAQAQGRGLVIDCRQYAIFALSIADYREVDASLEKVLGRFRAMNRDGDADALRVFEEEARRVWQERPSGDEAARSAFNRCQERLGTWPREREG